MTRKHFILATAGHVDHGKSSLVKALTGTDPDRLPEEKTRRITIDLGFAHLKLTSEDPADGCFSIGVIDVPGHEDFVKNMIAGIGSIDLALLAVAADDGWMAQTEEHLEILTYLGVQRVVVALTKIDLAQSEEAIETEVRNRLQRSPFAGAPIVRTSIVTSRGIDQLKHELSFQFTSLKSPSDIGKPRLLVDRAFSLRGVGTIVTGTVCGGVFARGDTVLIQPGGDHGRIRGAQNHNCEVERVAPGTRAAFNLSDVAVATREKNGIRRGNTITQARLGCPDKAVDVVLLPSLRTDRRRPSLKDGMRVRVHHGAGNFAARLLLETLNGRDNTQTAVVRLCFDQLVFFFVNDRVVLRDSSGRVTLAGAIVLDPRASGIRFRCPAQRAFLAARAEAGADVGTFVLTQAIRDHALVRSELLVQSRFAATEVDSAVSSLVRNGRLIAMGMLVFDASWWMELRNRAIALIDREHARHPETPGLAQSRLESELAREISQPQIFECLVADLCEHGFSRQGEILRRPTHRAAPPSQVQHSVTRIRKILEAANADPPSRRVLAPDITSQQALRFLRESAEIVELNGDIVLTSERFVMMRSLVVAFLNEHKTAGAGELRQVLQSSRRVVIPFLERLDRDRVTRRVGDKRVLVKI